VGSFRCDFGTVMNKFAPRKVFEGSVRDALRLKGGGDQIKEENSLNQYLDGCLYVVYFFEMGI
jgi:hypothetical protein